MNPNFEAPSVMSDYRPIPIPLRQRWRDFRTRFMPVVVFLVAVSATVLLWEEKSTGPMLVGEVYAPQGPVLAPALGMVENLVVQPYEDVRAGDVLGMIRKVPASQAEAALEVLRSEIRMIRLGAGDPVLDQRRNVLSWQSLKRDWMLGRIELASLRVRMRQAEADAMRYEKLVGHGAESQAICEQARSLFDCLVAEESEVRQLVDDLGKAVGESQPADGEGRGLPAEGLKSSLAWKEAELSSLEAQLEPLPLVAPYDGSVTLVYRRNGEFVSEGEPVVDIRASRADFIIGYARQPLRQPLEIGMGVEVIPRGGKMAEAGKARLVSIGPGFDALPAVLMRPLQAMSEERALPLLISLPEGSRLRPGEIVDLRLVRPDG